MVRSIRESEGFALVVVILLLILISALGMLSITQTTINMKVTGNRRVSEVNFYAGDAGIDVGAPFVEDTSFERAVPLKYSSFGTSNDVVNEITAQTIDRDDTLDDPETSPDLTFTVSGIGVSVDIDYLYATTAAGGAIEYASGYEGVGKGLGQGGAEVYYRINSIASGPLGTSARVGALYRLVSK